MSWLPVDRVSARLGGTLREEGGAGLSFTASPPDTEGGVHTERRALFSCRSDSPAVLWALVLARGPDRRSSSTRACRALELTKPRASGRAAGQGQRGRWVGVSGLWMATGNRPILGVDAFQGLKCI